MLGSGKRNDPPGKPGAFPSGIAHTPGRWDARGAVRYSAIGRFECHNPSGITPCVAFQAVRPVAERLGLRSLQRHSPICMSDSLGRILHNGRIANRSRAVTNEAIPLLPGSQNASAVAGALTFYHTRRHERFPCTRRAEHKPLEKPGVVPAAVCGGWRLALRHGDCS